jgi:2'-5' RNA ligase
MRLFTGIALPPHVMDNLARVLKELRLLAPLKWSPVENLHITSKFIGEWPEARLMELHRALENPGFVSGFELTVAGFGYFPNPHNPRAFFAGVQGGPELAELAARIDEALQPLGVAHEDRPYSPHLTLARIKNENIRKLREHIAHMTNFDFGSFPVSEFHLYSSKTATNGSIYTKLATYSLSSIASARA